MATLQLSDAQRAANRRLLEPDSPSDQADQTLKADIVALEAAVRERARRQTQLEQELASQTKDHATLVDELQLKADARLAQATAQYRAETDGLKARLSEAQRDSQQRLDVLEGAQGGLREKLEELEQRLASRSRELTERCDEVKRLRDECNAWKASRQSSQAEWESEKSQLTEEILELNASVESQRGELSGLNEVIAELNTKLSAAESRDDQREHDFAWLFMESEELYAAEFSREQKRREEVESRLGDHAKEIRSLKSKLASEIERRGLAFAQHQQDQQQLQVAVSQLADFDNVRRDLQHKLAEKKRANHDLHRSVSSMRERLLASESRAETISGSLAEVCQAHERDVNAAAEEVAENQRLQGQLLERCDEVEAAREDAARRLQQAETVAEARAAELSRKEQAQGLVEQELSATLLLVSEAERLAVSWKAKHDKTEDAFAALNRDHDALRQSNADLLRVHESQGETVQQLMAERDHLRRAKEEIAASHHAMIQEYVQLDLVRQIELAKLEDELADQRRICQQVTVQLETQSHDAQALQESNARTLEDSHAKALRASQAKAAEANRAMEEARRSSEEAKRAMQAAHAEKIEELETKITGLNQQIDRLQDTAVNQTQSFRFAESELRLECDALQTQLKTQLEVSDENLANQRLEIEQLQTVIRCQREAHESLSNDAATIGRQLETAESALRHANEDKDRLVDLQTSQFAGVQERLDELVVRLDEEQAGHEAAKLEIKRLSHERSERIAFLGKQRKTLLAEVSALTGEIQVFREQDADRKAEIASLCEVNQGLREAVADCKRSLERTGKERVAIELRLKEAETARGLSQNTIETQKHRLERLEEELVTRKSAAALEQQDEAVDSTDVELQKTKRQLIRMAVRFESVRQQLRETQQLLDKYSGRDAIDAHDIAIMQRDRTIAMLEHNAQAMQDRLQREAAERRKAEGTIRRHAEAPEGPPKQGVRDAWSKIDSRAQVERLTRQVEAVRNLAILERQRFQAELAKYKQEVIRLRGGSSGQAA